MGPFCRGTSCLAGLKALPEIPRPSGRKKKARRAPVSRSSFLAGLPATAGRCVAGFNADPRSLKRQTSSCRRPCFRPSRRRRLSIFAFTVRRITATPTFPFLVPAAEPDRPSTYLAHDPRTAFPLDPRTRQIGTAGRGGLAPAFAARDACLRGLAGLWRRFVFHNSLMVRPALSGIVGAERPRPLAPARRCRGIPSTPTIRGASTCRCRSIAVPSCNVGSHESPRSGFRIASSTSSRPGCASRRPDLRLRFRIGGRLDPAAPIRANRSPSRESRLRSCRGRAV